MYRCLIVFSPCSHRHAKLIESCLGCCKGVPLLCLVVNADRWCVRKRCDWHLYNCQYSVFCLVVACLACACFYLDIDAVACLQLSIRSLRYCQRICTHIPNNIIVLIIIRRNLCTFLTCHSKDKLCLFRGECGYNVLDYFCISFRNRNGRIFYFSALFCLDWNCDAKFFFCICDFRFRLDKQTNCLAFLERYKAGFFRVCICCLCSFWWSHWTLNANMSSLNPVICQLICAGNFGCKADIFLLVVLVKFHGARWCTSKLYGFCFSDNIHLASHFCPNIYCLTCLHRISIIIFVFFSIKIDCIPVVLPCCKCYIPSLYFKRGFLGMLFGQPCKLFTFYFDCHCTL